MTHNLTMVIPVFRLIGPRARNFWYVLKQLRKTGVNVLIVEQIKPGSSRVLKRKIEEMHDRSIKHLSVLIDDDQIHKSRLINRGVQACGTTHVWVNDADCLMDFQHVVNTWNPTHDFIRPYSVGLSLTQRETYQVMRDDRVDVDTNMNRREVEMYGALSFMFNRKKFIDIGMMNTKFVGWGNEDADIDRRVSTTNKIHVMDKPALHLWHPQPAINTNNFSTPDQTDETSRIIHVINYLDPTTTSCPHLGYRVWLADQSITQAHDQHNVMHLSCVTDQSTRVTRGLKQMLNRDCDTQKKLPHVKDLLHAALDHAKPGDHVLYTNADCVVSPDIYTAINNTDNTVVEYHRVDKPACESVEQLLCCEGEVQHDGIDGFLIRADVLRQTIDDFPDFLLGEPCWDLVLSHMLSDHDPVKNTSHLHHVQHDQQWSLSEPSITTLYNMQLARGHLPQHMFMHARTSVRHHTNKLCVMFLCCSREVSDGSLHAAVCRFFSYPCSRDKRFDVFVCVDNIDEPHKRQLSDQLAQITCECPNVTMHVHDVAIPQHDNVFSYDVNEWYTQRSKDPRALRLGTTNGINLQFFQSLAHVFQHENAYENVLLLECDCDVFRRKWFDVLHDQCDQHDHLVLGSKYRGTNEHHRTRWYADHLNGVAVYRNCEQMHQLLTRAERVIEQYVSRDDATERWMNFDVALLQAAIDMNVTDRLIDVDLISNYSDPDSSELSTEQILSRDMNTVILHKKQNLTNCT